MTRRTTLFLVCAFEVLLILFFVAWSALAETQDKNNWFIEGRYQKSLSEASGWKDNTVGGLYRYSAATGEGWESLNSVGAAIGRRFANQKTSVLLTYEDFGTSDWKADTFTDDNTLFPYTYGKTVFPVEISNLMLEVQQEYVLADDLNFVFIVGAGQSSLESDKYSLTITQGDPSSARLVGRGISKTNTSYRYGGGLVYSISEKTQLSGVLQKSEYGKAEVWNENIDGKIEFDTYAVEASIRLRYLF